MKQGIQLLYIICNRNVDCPRLSEGNPSKSISIIKNKHIRVSDFYAFKYFKHFSAETMNIIDHFCADLINKPFGIL